MQEWREWRYKRVEERSGRVRGRRWTSGTTSDKDMSEKKRGSGRADRRYQPSARLLLPYVPYALPVWRCQLVSSLALLPSHPLQLEVSRAKLMLPRSPSSDLLPFLLRRKTLTMNRGQKQAHRMRMKAVDNVIATVAASGVRCNILVRSRSPFCFGLPLPPSPSPFSYLRLSSADDEQTMHTNVGRLLSPAKGERDGAQRCDPSFNPSDELDFSLAADACLLLHPVQTSTPSFRESTKSTVNRSTTSPSGPRFVSLCFCSSRSLRLTIFLTHVSAVDYSPNQSYRFLEQQTDLYHDFSFSMAPDASRVAD
jgi:hypothetical protein